MALRTVRTITVGPWVDVRTRRDSEYDEYRVEIVREGKVREPETYYTNDRQDADDTAQLIADRLMGRKARSNPTGKRTKKPRASSPQIPKSQIQFVVNKMRVSATDAEVEAEMEKRLRNAPAAWTATLKRQAIAYAIKTHHANRGLYSMAMGSRRSNPRKKRKAPARRKTRRSTRR